MATDGGVLLSLRFERTSTDDPRPEELASVMEDMEGLYRAAPAAAALGVPVVELLAAYRASRADWAVAELSSDPYALRRVLPPSEVEDLEFWMTRARTLGRHYAYGRALPPPENAMRMRRLSLGSPFDFLAAIPAEYWQSGGFLLFLKAVEGFFNMPERIRTERVDLKARQAERRADEREAEVREARAAHELRGLRRGGGPFRLVEGEVLPDDNREAPPDR